MRSLRSALSVGLALLLATAQSSHATRFDASVRANWNADGGLLQDGVVPTLELQYDLPATTPAGVARSIVSTVENVHDLYEVLLNRAVSRFRDRVRELGNDNDVAALQRRVDGMGLATPKLPTDNVDVARLAAANRLAEVLSAEVETLRGEYLAKATEQANHAMRVGIAGAAPSAATVASVATTSGVRIIGGVALTAGATLGGAKASAALFKVGAEALYTIRLLSTGEHVFDALKKVATEGVAEAGGGSFFSGLVSKWTMTTKAHADATQAIADFRTGMDSVDDTAAQVALGVGAVILAGIIIYKAYGWWSDWKQSRAEQQKPLRQRLRERATAVRTAIVRITLAIDPAATIERVRAQYDALLAAEDFRALETVMANIEEHHRQKQVELSAAHLELFKMQAHQAAGTSDATDQQVNQLALSLQQQIDGIARELEEPRFEIAAVRELAKLIGLIKTGVIFPSEAVAGFDATLRGLAGDAPLPVPSNDTLDILNGIGVVQVVSAPATR